MLEHFVGAQNPVYDSVLDELRAGHKQSHWMWFIFPQLASLGRSDTAKRFGLSDREHAKAYASHPVLGARLRECVALTNAIEGRTAREIFGYPDYLKLQSCLTLFLLATDEEDFRIGLKKYYKGRLDGGTVKLLGSS